MFEEQQLMVAGKGSWHLLDEERSVTFEIYRCMRRVFLRMCETTGGGWLIDEDVLRIIDKSVLKDLHHAGLRAG